MFGRRKREEAGGRGGGARGRTPRALREACRAPGAHLPVPGPRRRARGLRRGRQRRAPLLRIRRSGAALGRAADAGLPGARLRQLPALPARRARHPDRGARGAAPASAAPLPEPPPPPPVADSRARTARRPLPLLLRVAAPARRRRWRSRRLPRALATACVAGCPGAEPPPPTPAPTERADAERPAAADAAADGAAQSLDLGRLRTRRREPTPSAGDAFAVLRGVGRTSADATRSSGSTRAGEVVGTPRRSFDSSSHARRSTPSPSGADDRRTVPYWPDGDGRPPALATYRPARLAAASASATVYPSDIDRERALRLPQPQDQLRPSSPRRRPTP